MIVRPAAIDDAEGIAVVHVLSWQAAYRGVVPQHHLDSLDVIERAEGWRSRLREPEVAGTQVLVAVPERGPGRVAGFISFGPARDESVAAESAGEVYAIYAHPQHWDRGVGAALLPAAEAAMGAQSRALAVLWVLRDNPRARGFYERQGWAFDGLEDVFTVAGADLPEVRYRKSLSPSSLAPPAPA